MSSTDEVGRTAHVVTQGVLGDDHPLSEQAREYGEKVVTDDEWPLHDVNLRKLTWTTATRAKRRHGNITYHSDGEATIRVSEHTYENAGLDACKETIRHELVHAWQHQHSGETREVDGTTVDVETGHGESFKVWVPLLDLQGRTATHYTKTRDDYNYILECPSCGYWTGKHRLCKSVRQAASGDEHPNYGYRYCTSCDVRLYLWADGRYLQHGTYTDDDIRTFAEGDATLHDESGVNPASAPERPRD